MYDNSHPYFYDRRQSAIYRSRVTGVGGDMPAQPYFYDRRQNAVHMNGLSGSGMEGLGAAVALGFLIAVAIPASIGFAAGRGKGALIGAGVGAASVFGYGYYKRTQSQKQHAAFEACVQAHRAAAPQTAKGQAAAFTECQVIFGILTPTQAAANAR